MEELPGADTPAETKPIAPVHDAEPIVAPPAKRESHSLAVRPRFRSTGTDRYDSYKVASTELLKIPFKLKSPTYSETTGYIKECQKYWDEAGGNATGGTHMLDTSPWAAQEIITEFGTSVGAYTSGNRITIDLNIRDGDYHGKLYVVGSGSDGNDPFQVEYQWYFHYSNGVVTSANISPIPKFATGNSPTFIVTKAFHYPDLWENSGNDGTLALNSSYDMHDLLENNSIMFTKFEAFSVDSFQVDFNPVDNWLRSDASIFVNFVSDPYCEPLPPIESTTEIGLAVNKYNPRYSNQKIFSSGHKASWMMPIADSKFYTLQASDSDLRFTSPGVIAIGVYSPDNKKFAYELTLTAKINYFCQTRRKTAPSEGSTIQLDFPKTKEILYKSSNRFLQPLATYTVNEDYHRGTYFALQSMNYNLTLPNGMPFSGVLSKFHVTNDVAGRILNFEATQLQMADYNFEEGVEIATQFSFMDSHFYFIPE